jgi:hypothetical protein
MKIETKFNIGENAFIIDNDKIISLPINGIEYISKTITYSFRIRTASSLIDKDKIIFREEANCYKSIDELSTFYKNEK